VAAPGIEPLTAGELAALGVKATAEPGGASWRGDALSVARANLWLRTASRVVVRVAEFKATAFHELERRARHIPWERFLRPAAPVALRVTCRKSRLYHSDAVAQRVLEAIEHRLHAAPAVAPALAPALAPAADEQDDAEDAGAAGAQLFIVRFLHDVCTVSADTSGALLHLRGYRQALAKAPLRETLAAAILIGSGWAGDPPLEDPMCGSGTIPIEGALIARRIAPGMKRTFSFLEWPETDATRWRHLRDDAEEQQRAVAPATIRGADRDAGAIDAAHANAERAGVSGDVEFVKRALSALPEEPAPGLLATNPPYGVRVGEAAQLRNLYASLGNTLERARPGWTVAILSANRRLEQQLRLGLDERFRASNGGIPVRLLVGNVSRG